MRIAVLGAGRLGSVLVKRFSECGYEISVSDSNESCRQAMASLSGVNCFESTHDAVAGANIVVLAVKPVNVADLARSIVPGLEKKAVIVSMAAGVNLDALTKFFPHHSCMRAMPNLASAVGMSLTAMTGHEDDKTKKLLKCLGEVVSIDESMWHLFTGAVGSGPAFICRMLENVICNLHFKNPELDKKLLERWLISMTKGTMAVLSAEDMSLEALEKSVTAPNGTTEAGLNVGEGEYFDMVSAILAAAERSQSIEEEICHAPQSLD